MMLILARHLRITKDKDTARKIEIKNSINELSRKVQHKIVIV